MGNFWRFGSLLVAAALQFSPASAQIAPGGGVQQSGAVTPNNCTKWVSNGVIADAGACGGGSGTVTSVSVTTANGVSGSVANPTSTPAISLTLGAITPSTVAIGAGSAITSSGPGGALGSNAYSSTAFAPLASPTFTGTVTIPNGGVLGKPTSIDISNAAAATAATATCSSRLVLDGSNNLGKSVCTPNIQTFTSGTSQTYTTPANTTYIEVWACGGGGGGGGGGTTPGAATSGTSTIFGASITAGGGTQGTAGAGGAGGSAAGGNDNEIGSDGTGGIASNSTAVVSGSGGPGGAGFRGGNGGGNAGNAGSAAKTNSCSGGGGGAANFTVSNNSGGGGGAGGYVYALIAAPAATYTYTIGTKGNGGTAGTSGNAGGDGGAGWLMVKAYQ